MSAKALEQCLPGPIVGSLREKLSKRQVGGLKTRGRVPSAGAYTRHFSDQPKPFVTLKTSPKRLNNPSIPAMKTP